MRGRILRPSEGRIGAGLTEIIALITQIHSNYYLDSEVLMNTYQEEVGRKDFFLPCLLCNQLDIPNYVTTCCCFVVC